MSKEEWRDIEGFEGYFQVSNMGRVRSLDRNITDSNGNKFRKNGKILSLSSNKTKDSEDTGYLYIYLYKDGGRTRFYIHRLVANAFIPNDDPENKTQVNHKDENKLNNCVDNLEWCDQRYNNNYGTKNERAHQTKLKNNVYIISSEKRKNNSEWRKKASETGKKYIMDANKKRQRKIRCSNNGVVFDNSVKAAKYAGLKNSTNITKCCKLKEQGIIKSAGKDPLTGELLQWEYYIEED